MDLCRTMPFSESASGCTVQGKDPFEIQDLSSAGPEATPHRVERETPTQRKAKHRVGPKSTGRLTGDLRREATIQFRRGGPPRHKYRSLDGDAKRGDSRARHAGRGAAPSEAQSRPEDLLRCRKKVGPRRPLGAGQTRTASNLRKVSFLPSGARMRRRPVAGMRKAEKW